MGMVDPCIIPCQGHRPESGHISAPHISPPSRCSIDALRRNETPIYHSAQSRNLLLPLRTLAGSDSEVEIQRGGRRAASVMRNQRVKRGL